MDGGRPEPGTILQACKAQVAELEQWLDKTKVSLGSDPQTPKMQQMVELQLGDFQVRGSSLCAASHPHEPPFPGVCEHRKAAVTGSPLPAYSASVHWQTAGNCWASVSGAAFLGLS